MLPRAVAPNVWGASCSEVAMRFVVGTDFSFCAREASDFAATLAARLGAAVTLVHAVDSGRRQQRAAAELQAEAIKLRAGGATIEAHLEQGPPDRVLLAAVARTKADLVAAGMPGLRTAGRWRLGSTLDRLAQLAPVPVLAVRYVEAFHPWLLGEEPLSVLFADDLSAAAAEALVWLRVLGAIGPLRVTAASVSERDVGDTIAARVRGGLAGLDVEIRSVVRPGPRVAEELLALEVETRAALLLAGGRQRGALQRVWRASVSRSLLAGSLASVLSVPARAPVEVLPETVEPAQA